MRLPHHKLFGLNPTSSDKSSEPNDSLLVNETRLNPTSSDKREPQFGHLKFSKCCLNPTSSDKS